MAYGVLAACIVPPAQLARRARRVSLVFRHGMHPIEMSLRNNSSCIWTVRNAQQLPIQWFHASAGCPVEASALRHSGDVLQATTRGLHTTAATITSANYIARGNRGWEKDAMVV